MLYMNVCSTAFSSRARPKWTPKPTSPAAWLQQSNRDGWNPFPLSLKPAPPCTSTFYDPIWLYRQRPRDLVSLEHAGVAVQHGLQCSLFITLFMAVSAHSDRLRQANGRRWHAPQVTSGEGLDLKRRVDTGRVPCAPVYRVERGQTKCDPPGAPLR